MESFPSLDLLPLAPFNFSLMAKLDTIRVLYQVFEILVCLALETEDALGDLPGEFWVWTEDFVVVGVGSFLVLF